MRKSLNKQLKQFLNRNAEVYVSQLFDTELSYSRWQMFKAGIFRRNFTI